MNRAIEPLTEAELEELPVFPLPRVVLFPGTLLPLHLFEPRYRRLAEDCVKKGPKAMAVALLEPGYEEDYEGRPPIHSIAGVGRIVEHERRPDGRYDLLLAGLSRARLEELPVGELPYRRAKATLLEDRVPDPRAVARLESPLLATATAIVAHVRAEHPDFDLGLEPEIPPGIMADRIADRLVADPERRQRLLEAQDVKVRFALLTDFLAELLVQLEPMGDGPLH